LKKHSGIFTHKKINNGLQNHVHSHEMKAPDISRLITPNYFLILFIYWHGRVTSWELPYAAKVTWPAENVSHYHIIPVFHLIST